MPKIDRTTRGKEYAQLAHQLKEDANWTCKWCGWQPSENNERINIIIHHQDRNPYNDDLSNLVVICESCHYKLTWMELP